MDDKNKTLNAREEADEALGISQRTITFFNSFEEAKDSGRRQMAEMSAKQRLEKLEQMRRHFLKALLLPNGKWPLIQPVLKIKEGFAK